MQIVNFCAFCSFKEKINIFAEEHHEHTNSYIQRPAEADGSVFSGKADNAEQW